MDIEQSIERGRQLVAAGNLCPVKMVDAVDVIAYRHSQRELVARRGTCSANCRCDLVRTRNGRDVCPHTFDRCDRRHLQSIVETYSHLFRNTQKETAQ